MTFRKDSLLFYQSEICYIVLLLLCFFLVPMIGLGLSLLYALPFMLLILVNPRMHNEFITINECGISCNKAGIQLWSYEWNNIAQLQKNSRYLLPTIEVITCNMSGELDLVFFSRNYFQLGRTAKKAIKKYYVINKSP